METAIFAQRIAQWRSADGERDRREPTNGAYIAWETRQAGGSSPSRSDGAVLRKGLRFLVRYSPPRTDTWTRREQTDGIAKNY